MHKAIKRLGQNFLRDDILANKMIDALEISENDTIIEIGPGPGALTQKIVDKISKFTNSNLIAVEIDSRFSSDLKEKYANNRRVEIVEKNILDWLPLFENNDLAKNIKIIGSLPYYITSPILHKITKMSKHPDLAVLLMQKEVGEKVTAEKPDSNYMAAFINSFFQTQYLFTIPNDKFYPTPKVDGGVVKLTKREISDPEIKFLKDNIEKYEGFLHKGHSNPRKMLNKVFSKEELQIGNIEPSIRAQNLDNQDWKDFFIKLQKNKL